jgi:hypothetical protein
MTPKEKQTELGLYLTAKEAYDLWKTDPDEVMILDVRIPEEYLFVGHPAMAWMIAGNIFRGDMPVSGLFAGQRSFTEQLAATGTASSRKSNKPSAPERLRTMPSDHCSSQAKRSVSR